MRRVAIIGCGGAGKTTLARELGSLLDLPVVHADALYWRGGATSPEAWPELHAKLVARDGWVLDAMKISTLEQRLVRADTVVFLDLPRRTCLRGIVSRRQRYRRRERPEVGRSDRLTWAYVRWVWRFRRDVRPTILELLARADCDVVVLRSRRAVDAYADELRAPRVAARPAEAAPDAVALL